VLAKLNTWGPITVLAVLAVSILLAGGVINVITDPAYTFRGFLDDLKWAAAALAAGAGVGRGLLAGLTNAGLAVNLPGTDPHAPDTTAPAPGHDDAQPELYPNETLEGADPGDPPLRPLT
jgi:hypothetical protein